MRRCTHCKKLTDNFYQSSKQDRCKDCHRASNDAARRRKNDMIREFVQSYKSATPCKDYNQVFPFYVMDFDHLRDKKFMISKMLRYNLDQVKTEIDKCDLVCANCHRERTYQRLFI
jgi:hypothetical protein